MGAKQELEKLDRRRSKLQADLNALEKKREGLRAALRVEKAKATGLVKGVKYRIIPAVTSGPIEEGIFSRFYYSRYNSEGADAVFRLEASGKHPARIAHFTISNFEFERVNVPRGGKK